MSHSVDPCVSVRLNVLRVSDRGCRVDRDTVACETPVGIEIDGIAGRVLFATPADLEDLVRGYVLTTGLVRTAAEVREISVDPATRTVSVRTTAAYREDRSLGSNGDGRPVDTSPLGGAVSPARDPHEPPLAVRPDQVIALAQELSEGTDHFRETGSLHRALLLDLATEARIAMEDVSRHNALDKAVGRAMAMGVDLSRSVLARTGRTSAEMLAKIHAAGIVVTLSRGAPTSKAVDLAHEHGITLIGFARGMSFVVYSHAERVLQ